MKGGATPLDAFDWVLSGQESRNVYDNTRGLGSSACRISLSTGAVGGGGGFSGIRVGEGGEIWHRYYVYLPSTTQWDSANGWTKFLRQSFVTDGAFEAEKLDVGILNNAAGFYMGNDEVHAARTDSEWSSMYMPHSVPLDRWFILEWYIKFSYSGTGTMRLWVDNELIGQLSNQHNLEQRDSTTASAFFMTNYNGHGVSGGAVGPPEDGDLWIDNVVFATHMSTPPNLDASGNRRIGNWTE